MGKARPHPRCAPKQVRSSLHRRTLRVESGRTFSHTRNTFHHQLPNKFALQLFSLSISEGRLTLPIGHASGPRPRAKSMCHFQEP